MVAMLARQHASAHSRCGDRNLPLLGGGSLNWCDTEAEALIFGVTAFLANQRHGVVEMKLGGGAALHVPAGRRPELVLDARITGTRTNNDVWPVHACTPHPRRLWYHGRVRAVQYARWQRSTAVEKLDDWNPLALPRTGVNRGIRASQSLHTSLNGDQSPVLFQTGTRQLGNSPPWLSLVPALAPWIATITTGGLPIWVWSQIQGGRGTRTDEGRTPSQSRTAPATGPKPRLVAAPPTPKRREELSRQLQGVFSDDGRRCREIVEKRRTMRGSGAVRRWTGDPVCAIGGGLWPVWRILTRAEIAASRRLRGTK
jgi:hypothetical protein